MNVDLYRADSVPAGIRNGAHSGSKKGRTLAEHFIGNGLLAKFADGGSSDLLKGKSLEQLVVEHVGYAPGTPAQELSWHSPFISFSREQERATAFLERNRKVLERLVCCDFEDATHFIFLQRVDLGAQCQPGLWCWTYVRDGSKMRALLEGAAKRATQSGSLQQTAQVLMNAAAVGAAHGTKHVALVIDVVEFLRGLDANRKTALDATALESSLANAERDKEWLILPQDPMPDGHGHSARLQMNAALTVVAYFNAT